MSTLPTQPEGRMCFAQLILPFLLVLLAAHSIHAQESTNLPRSGSPRTFFDIQREFYSTHTPPQRAMREEEADEESDGEWARFKRWEWFMEPRVGPTGKMFNTGVLFDALNEYTAMRAKHLVPTTATSGARWTPLGPERFANFTGVNGGIGRVSCIRFHPTDKKTIFIGTPEGGMWKTTNGGTSWSTPTDHLPNLGVTDVAINPRDPNIIYIATGDGDDAGMYGNPYSYGVMKTIDGGASWAQTGLSFNLPDKILIARIAVNPANPNIVLAAVSTGPGTVRGMWRSVDAGVTWTKVDGGAIYAIEFKTDNPAVVFCSGYGNFRKSIDSGATWVTSASPILPTYQKDGVARTAIAVSTVNPNIVYIIYTKGGQYYGLYKTTDAGATWALQSDQSSRNIITAQGDYDLVLAVSPKDANIVFAGGQRMYMSTNSGTSWTATAFEIHVDQHALAFEPGSGTTIYSGNDGGMYLTTDRGSNWTGISDGLQISQYYRLACSATNNTLLYAGAQDNGVHRYNGTAWTSAISGADGTECVVDYVDENSVYMEYQNGYMVHTNDGGSNYTYIAPDSNGHWVTPLVMHPTNHQTIYSAYRELYKSTNEGANWSKLSTALAGNDNMKSLAVAASNDKYIYMGTYIKLFRTSNGGTTWQDIGAGTPIWDTAALTSVMVHPSNPRWAWLTFSGFSAGEKVYKTTDAGATWTNISGSLANVPVNCAVYQKGSNDVVYIGTDLGVFWRDNTMDDWAPFNEGLPNVSVIDLEIQYNMKALRAATFGRGVWETPLRGALPPGAAVLSSPTNGTSGVPLLVPFQWNALMNSAAYHLQVSKDSLFGTFVRDVTGITTLTYSTLLAPPSSRLYWRVAGSNLAGEGPWSPVWRFSQAGEVGINQRVAIPGIITLEQNHPNPFSNATTFRFALTVPGHATLRVTNLLGQTVAIPYDETAAQGEHEISWNSDTLPSGMYRYSLRVDGVSQARGMWIVR